MKMKMFVLALIALIIFSGCTKNELNYTVTEIDGIKNFHNKNIPSDPNFKLYLKKVLEIKGNNNSDSLENFYDPQYLTTDSEENIYILDSYSCSVKKYNSAGKFINSFGRQGQGPGEFIFPFYLNNNNDTIEVTDIGRSETSKFNLEGEYIRSSFNTKGFFLRYAVRLTKGRMIGFKKSQFQEDHNWFADHELIIIDKDYKTVKNLRDAKVRIDNSDYRINEFYNSFTVSKDKIYVAKDGTNKYEIDVYDFDGNNIYSIQKQYRELKFTKKELESFQEQENLMNKRYNIDPYVVKPKAKRTINAMYVDKNENLWVIPSVERNDENIDDYYVDIFDNGVFVNRVKLDNFLKAKDYFCDQKVFFIGDKIYSVDNKNTKIDVYEY
ncbi:MAG: 6-bladed beta-propeller [Candidatus Delongbacteria bacterium]|jgi:hypothetical protein|nr:6-bladed beta-propeller [Candidatus Delongbacteria bacterium]MDD4205376.1 6-bladed beta-propeller [Candidatus Delongbacteria bacterium]